MNQPVNCERCGKPLAEHEWWALQECNARPLVEGEPDCFYIFISPDGDTSGSNDSGECAMHRKLANVEDALVFWEGNGVARSEWVDAWPEFPSGTLAARVEPAQRR
jgi:hypothetical protein